MFGLFESIHFFGVKKIIFVGTDIIGRDLLGRIIFGGRVSLSIGLVGVLILVVLGTIISTVSGYFGGWYDNIIQRIIEIVGPFTSCTLDGSSFNNSKRMAIFLCLSRYCYYFWSHKLGWAGT